MVRIALLPKPPDRYLARNVTTRNYDAGLLAELLRPNKHDQPVVSIAVCQDGRGDWNFQHELKLERIFQSLFDHWSQEWGHRYRVVIHPFSFLEDTTRGLDVLRLADVFYMCGIFHNNLSDHWRLRMERGGASHRLVLAISELVQYNVLGYVGVCGGAYLAGATYPCKFTTLDLLLGTNVHYDSSVNPVNVSVISNPETDLVQITTGCGILIIIKPGIRQVICFPTTKNSAQWLKFARENTLELQRLVERKAQQTFAYSDETGNPWWFRLDGTINKGFGDKVPEPQAVRYWVIR